MSHAAAVPDLAQALGGRRHDVGQLECRRELQAGIAHERESPTAFVEPTIERGVGHGLRGDLGEALQELDARKITGMVVEQRHQADDLAAHHQGQMDAGAVTGGDVAGAIGRAQVGVERDVVDETG